MYWINVIGAVCGTAAMVLVALKGRRALAAYTVFSKILPIALPAWLVSTLPLVATAMLVIEFLSRRNTST
jgi:hypothetical protein